MAYPKTEQETVLVFELETSAWSAYSTVPKHIRKLQAIADEVTVLETDEYGAKAVKAVLTEKQVRMVLPPKPKELTDEQRQELSERMRKARSSFEANAVSDASNEEVIR